MAHFDTLNLNAGISRKVFFERWVTSAFIIILIALLGWLGNGATAWLAFWFAVTLHEAKRMKALSVNRLWLFLNLIPIANIALLAYLSITEDGNVFKDTEKKTTDLVNDTVELDRCFQQGMKASEHNYAVRAPKLLQLNPYNPSTEAAKYDAWNKGYAELPL